MSSETDGSLSGRIHRRNLRPSRYRGDGHTENVPSLLWTVFQYCRNRSVYPGRWRCMGEIFMTENDFEYSEHATCRRRFARFREPRNAVSVRCGENSEISRKDEFRGIRRVRVPWTRQTTTRSGCAHRQIPRFPPRWNAEHPQPENGEGAKRSAPTRPAQR